ncbi:hypothetical protein AZF37_08325 [endosymbiont 'TC1' of Trimyema compressum]|uniref:excinuclease ABC subunit UvrC n=1 Tax=endosymbiont 'TC1' of Trimyema compressum TaxID=243899 RepID=UPI0007F06C52|nr:excinuclease ABC subunit UvrC [endosymbiont 'TC1' of Trimyema compressum]AMP21161.1 hypothetical protein AZF37_08325 [endosymbiont 'TC1' of Trimyema compressum]
MEDKIQNKLNLLPKSSGVYEMLDENGKVIYVGKSINLKNRVSSYFKGKKDAKTEALVKQIRDFRFTVTESELEALVLECNLIKEKKPKYNILLRDDKNYPYLKIRTDHPFPRLEVVRRRKKDSALYFGPYTNTTNMREVIKIIESVFTLRSCSDHELKHRFRPCLNYQIKRCFAPCVGYISEKEYAEIINDVVLFLTGKEKSLLRHLKVEMKKASEEMAFEKAAKIRDQVNAINRVIETQRMDVKDLNSRDVIGFYEGAGVTSAVIFFIREGKVIDKESYFLDHLKGEAKEDVLKAFLEQYYYGHLVPREILLPFKIEGMENLEHLFSIKRKKKADLVVPQKGEKKALIRLAYDNAKENYEQKKALKKREEEKRKQSLEGLKNFLKLQKIPKRIECYDISHIQGSHTVASMVVFTDGVPDKGQYRKFKIRTVDGPDDFKSMEEVLERRFKNFGKDKEGFNILPDLLVIDGGKGQLSSARKILKKLGLSHVATFGLAKREELLFKEDELDPIVLPRQSESFYLVQRIRDEAHRFAITFHRQQRDDSMTASIFDEIEGVGPKRKKDLLQAFGSVSGIRKASVEEIVAVIGNQQLGERVKDIIGDEKN